MDLISPTWLATIPPALHKDMHVTRPLFESDDIEWIFWLDPKQMEKDYDNIGTPTIGDDLPLKKGWTCLQPIDNDTNMEEL